MNIKENSSKTRRLLHMAATSLFCLLFLGYMNMLFANGKIKISGNVTVDDKPTAGVTVKLQCEVYGATQTHTKTTDAYGAYSFEISGDAKNCRVIIKNSQAKLSETESCDPSIVSGDEVIRKVCCVYPGSVTTGIDFCFWTPLAPITIGDLVFCDMNDNGKYDAGVDQPLQGVKVELECQVSDGTQKWQAATTDANGLYEFEFKLDKRLSVDCKVKVNVNQSALAGKEPCDPSIVQEGNAVIDIPGLRSKACYLDADFCFRPAPAKVKIGDLVYCDMNNNGVFEPGIDEPLAGVKVDLECKASDGSTTTKSTTTNANGLYNFEFSLAEGLTTDCKVRVDVNQNALAGKEPCDPSIVQAGKATIEVAGLQPGDVYEDADFCFRFPPAQVTIGDFVFCDNNGNHEFDPGIDEPLANVSVEAVCVLSNGETRTEQTTTDFNGNYSFLFNLPANTVIDACDVKINTTQPALGDCNIPCCPDRGGSPGCEKGRKPIALTFEYTGAGCAASNNQQDKKASCSGNANGAEPVTLRISKKGDGKDVTLISNVMIGDVVTIRPSDVEGKPKDTFPSSMVIEILGANQQVLETNEIHTSCSAPLNVGDVYGSMALRAVFLEGDEVSEGNTAICERAAVEGNLYIISLGPLQPGDQDLNADFCFRKDASACAKGLKVAEITFRYTGEGCAASNNQQDKKSSCSGNANGTEPVSIRVAKKAGEKGGTTFPGIMIGDVVTIVPSDVDGKSSSTFPSSITIEILNGNQVLETNEIHTSCSAPLAVGDQFGSLLVTRLVLTGKGDKSAAKDGLEPEMEMDVVTELPSEFALLQNYPNPFNPETVVRFQLAQTSDIMIKVYNTQGQEIATLARGTYQAGQHGVTWNGKNANGIAVASGTYLVRLEAGAFSQVRMMTLLR